MTRIVDFKVRPVRDKYASGQHVVLSGRLEYPFFWWWFRVPGVRQITIISDSVPQGVGFTSGGEGDPRRGEFMIPVILPFSPGLAVYRALFDAVPDNPAVGACQTHWHAWWPVHLGASMSDPIQIEVSEDVPPLPPSVPSWTGITAKQSYHNYLLEGKHWTGCFIGELREDYFYPIVITYDGIKYCHGSLVDFQACSKGITAMVDVKTAAAPISGLWDVLSWVGRFSGEIRVLVYGDRIIGVHADDLKKLVFYDLAAFKEAIEIIAE